MNYLIDTHILLWILNDDERLSKKVKNIYLNSSNIIYLSMASIWELSIKSSLNKINLGQPLKFFIHDHVVQNDIHILPIDVIHLSEVEILPFHHRDPFDRLIIAQSLSENMKLLSVDEIFDQYDVQRVF